MLVVVLALGMGTGCQTPTVMPGPEGQTRPADDAAPAWPDAWPDEWPEGRLFEVDPAASEVRIIVYPDGPLARFGHPHVIGGPVVRGQVMMTEPFEQSALRLVIDVRAIELDRAEWRADEGFDPEMSASDIRNTRDNMLSESQLDAKRHPEIRIESLGMSGPAWQPDIDVRVEVAGRQRELTVPVSLAMNADGLVASGRFSFNQSDFGITPFSAAGGNLRVADAVLVRFRIVATQP